MITASPMRIAFTDCGCGAENETATGCAVENWVNVRKPHRGGAAEMIVLQSAVLRSLPVDFTDECRLHSFGRCRPSLQSTAVPLPNPATHAEARAVKTVKSSPAVTARLIPEC